MPSNAPVPVAARDTWPWCPFGPGHRVAAGCRGRGGTRPDQARGGDEARSRRRHRSVAPRRGGGHERATRRELAVGDEPGGAVEHPARQSRSLAARDEVFARTVPHQLADRRAELLVALPSDQRVLQCGIGELRWVLDHLEERAPVTGLVRGDAERTVGAFERAAGGPSDLDEPSERVEPDRVVLLDHEVLARQHLVHREVDALRTHDGDGPERGQHGHGRVHARFVPAVAPGDRDRWALDRTDPRHVAAHGVRDHRGGAPSTFGPSIPNGVMAHTIACGAQARVSDAASQPGSDGPRGRRHHHDVGTGTESFEHTGIALVHDDRALRRVVVREEQRCLGVVAAERRHPTQGIAARGLDQDDVGTEIGQQPCAVRADRTTQVDDAHAVERSGPEFRIVHVHRGPTFEPSFAPAGGTSRCRLPSSASAVRRSKEEHTCLDHSPIGSRS